MLLYTYEENIKQILRGSTKHYNFLVISTGVALKELTKSFQVLIHVHPYHP